MVAGDHNIEFLKQELPLLFYSVLCVFKQAMPEGRR